MQHLLIDVFVEVITGQNADVLPGGYLRCELPPITIHHHDQNADDRYSCRSAGCGVFLRHLVSHTKKSWGIKAGSKLARLQTVKRSPLDIVTCSGFFHELSRDTLRLTNIPPMQNGPFPMGTCGYSVMVCSFTKSISPIQLGFLRVE